MRKICEAWNSIPTQASGANTPLSAKMAPTCGDDGAINEQLSGYYGQNKASAWIQFVTKLFVSLNQLMRYDFRTWEGNSTCLCYPMTPVSV